MPDANEPTVLGLLFEGQTRIEAELTAGLAEFRGEMRGLTSRVERLERDRVERAAHLVAQNEVKDRAWTRREKVAGAIAGIVMLGGVWFGDTLASLLTRH